MKWMNKYDCFPPYGAIVATYDNEGYYNLNLARFIAGHGFVSIITNQSIDVTHWCELPERTTAK